ncbi:MAG: hypothetical protein KPEEDBHJ_02302 [Anaerolineales bacterium]|nr:hypothetical protein [Anaerolineales bacterium]
MIRLPKTRPPLFLLFFIAGFGLILLVGWLTEFHALSNDYWNILYYGRNMTLSRPESLYNGFYPFGYAFLIGQMPFTYVLPLSHLLNALLAGLLVASVSTLVSCADSIPATLTAFCATVAAPFVYQNAITLSPDIGAAAFTAFAVLLLTKDWLAPEPQTSVCRPGKLKFVVPILIGVSLGLSFLWRTHALVSILAILIGYFLLAGIRPLRPRLILIGALAVTVGLQVAVNLVSGHGAFETGQAFNLYKFFHGVDWTHPPTPADIQKFSLIQTIAEDPARAWGLYRPFLYYFLSHAWAAVLSLTLAPKGRYARFSLFSLLFIVLYAVPISLSDSARSPVILMCVYLASVAILPAVLSETAKKFLPSLPRLEWIVFLVFIAAGFLPFYNWAAYDFGITRAAIAERRNLTAVEQALLSNGMTSPSEVFADRYDFYTPNTMPYRSRQIGNWSAGWVWGYAEEFPELPNDSWESFAAACREQGVRFLVLSQNSHYRGAFFPPIYNEEADITALGLRFIAQRGKMRLYVFDQP